LSQLLRAVLGDERFPVDVEKLAMEVSTSRFPKDPLKAIKGDSLPGFEGALYPLGDPREGWAIIYNNRNVSPGRTRFTIGHEFGHYLAHRQLLPDGIECDDKAVIQRAGIVIEKEADEFAAYLLMPFDDFRSRLSAADKPGIDEISACAERYGVSLIAATLRWLEYTDRRAVFVVSRDGGAVGRSRAMRHSNPEGSSGPPNRHSCSLAPVLRPAARSMALAEPRALIRPAFGFRRRPRNSRLGRPGTI
jgi:hypothetical protein